MDLQVSYPEAIGQHHSSPPSDAVPGQTQWSQPGILWQSVPQRLPWGGENKEMWQQSAKNWTSDFTSFIKNKIPKAAINHYNHTVKEWQWYHFRSLVLWWIIVCGVFFRCFTALKLSEGLKRQRSTEKERRHPLVHFIMWIWKWSSAVHNHRNRHTGLKKQ